MRKLVAFIFFITLWCYGAHAASKPHVINFGQWTSVKFFVGPNEDQSVDMKIRPLYVDGRLREFTTGPTHDITDTLFVVQKAFRLNDWLPEDQEKVQYSPPGSRTGHQWKWQRGGWLMVDRNSGRITAVKLPEFDPFYSDASWYRDYAAYCGLSDSGEKLYAVVFQLGRRKPVVHRELGAARNGDLPDSECAAPDWQRQPVRVTFTPVGYSKLTFAVRGHAADVATDDDTGQPQQP